MKLLGSEYLLSSLLAPRGDRMVAMANSIYHAPPKYL